MAGSVEGSSDKLRAWEPRDPRHLEVHDAISCGRHTLVLVGELDLASAPYLETMIERICAESTHAITLDLSKLSFIDSTGLYIMISTSKRCEALGYDFLLIPGAEHIQRLFKLTGLLDRLPFQAEAA
jgi:anti-sigma B factor antagonist